MWYIIGIDDLDGETGHIEQPRLIRGAHDNIVMRGGLKVKMTHHHELGLTRGVMALHRKYKHKTDAQIPILNYREK